MMLIKKLYARGSYRKGTWAPVIMQKKTRDFSTHQKHVQNSWCQIFPIKHLQFYLMRIALRYQ